MRRRETSGEDEMLACGDGKGMVGRPIWVVNDPVDGLDIKIRMHGVNRK